MTYDPGRDAAVRYPDWVIRHRPLLGVPEVLCRRRKVILLDDSHTPAGKRCSLAHGIAHIDLKHQSWSGVLDARQEVAADRLAARRLISVETLAEAWCWTDADAEVAAELVVEPHYLEVRMRHLTKAERLFLRRHIRAKERTA